MTETLRNCVAWAQHVKQMIMLTTGIETKRQKDMNKGELQHFMYEEYKNWIDICEQKFPNAAVQGWLEFTTGTRSAKVNGAYLYRNFCEGLRAFHKCAPIWEQTLTEGTSGKAKEEMWKRFCYLLNCNRTGSKPEESTPKDFDWEKTEKQKWMYVFKWMGPPCEFLELGDKKNATNSCPIRPNYQNAAQEPKNVAGRSCLTSTQGRRQPKEPE